MADPATPNLLKLTAQIAAAYVAANTIDAASVPGLIRDVRQALTRAATPVPEQVQQAPAVPINRSVQHGYLICLEDGAKVKALKRYLRRFNLTPETYRAKWQLPKTYPMTAPASSASRADLARKTGFGRLPVMEPHVADVPVDTIDEMPASDLEKRRHTAASVFANFPSSEPEAEDAVTASVAGKSARKRFGQQMIRSGSRKGR